MVKRYHRPLATELPRLRGMAEAVVRAHGPKDPVRLRRIATAVTAISDEIGPHLVREEATACPRILAGGDGCAPLRPQGRKGRTGLPGAPRDRCSHSPSRGWAFLAWRAAGTGTGSGSGTAEDRREVAR